MGLDLPHAILFVHGLCLPSMALWGYRLWLRKPHSFAHGTIHPWETYLPSHIIPFSHGSFFAYYKSMDYYYNIVIILLYYDISYSYMIY
jgi:hypothetical protein